MVKNIQQEGGEIMNTKEINAMMQKYGIANLLSWVKEYKEFETYVYDNYPEINDEAWSSIISKG